ncbi:hypothetical protein D3C87_1704910 [compost metagenome]
MTTHAGIFQLLGESDPRTTFLQARQDLLLVVTNAGDDSQASNHCTFHSIPLPQFYIRDFASHFSVQMYAEQVRSAFFSFILIQFAP